ncbi:hypothetical protein [Ancylobacter sp.]|uniref:hypothetical protein n=1 Tax=Ancylobacter sp. TaxID=1872567 RepID=UPI003BADB51B
MTTENTEELDVPLEIDVKPEAAPEPSVSNEEILALRQQIEAETRKREDAERRAQEAESLRDRESAGRVSEAAQRIAAQETAIVNAIAAKTAEAERLAEQAAVLFEEGKFREGSLLNQKGGKIQAEVDRLEELRGRLVEEKARVEEAAKAPRETDPLAHLSPRSREWAREHPEFFPNGQPTRKAIAAHHAALADDIQPDTPAYFDYINRHLGLVKDEPAEPAPKAERSRPPATAPVSRSVPESRSSNTRTITLTRAQQEAAELAHPNVPKSEAHKRYAQNLDALRREGVLS